LRLAFFAVDLLAVAFLAVFFELAFLAVGDLLALAVRDDFFVARLRVVFASPDCARCLLTVRAAISSALSVLAPRSLAESLMCSYWRSRFALFNPRGGMGSLREVAARVIPVPDSLLGTRGGDHQMIDVRQRTSATAFSVVRD
jgi:hypothetical protein